MLTISEFNRITGKHFDENEANVATLAKAKGATAADVKAFIESAEYALRPKTGYHVLREFVSWYKRGGAPKAKRGGRDTKRGSGENGRKAEGPTEGGEGATAEGEGEGEGSAADGGEADGQTEAEGTDGEGGGQEQEPKTEPKADGEQGAKEPKAEPKKRGRKKAAEPKAEPKPNEESELVKKVRALAAAGLCHEQMPRIIKAMEKHVPVYMYGPAGSGKSYIAEQAADLLGADFHFTNKVDMKVDLEGYGDAGGRYVETEFYRAMKHGGVFFFDEADASDSNAFTWTNAATSSRTAVFPIVGQVHAPNDLYFIAAGNTCGRGADEIYTGRNALDGATLNRFTRVKVDYDPKIEDKLGSPENVAFVRALRRAAEAHGIELIASYRTIKNLEVMAEGGTYEEAVESCVTAGMTEDDIYALRDDAKMRRLIEQGNPFAAAL